MKTYAKGVWGERVSVMWLRLKGYQIIARRYRTPVGEIDVLARKGSSLVVVEVKTRAKDDLEGILRVSQQRRLEQAAHYVIKQARWYKEPLNMRFDIMVIIPWRLPRHFKAAWVPNNPAF